MASSSNTQVSFLTSQMNESRIRDFNQRNLRKVVGSTRAISVTKEEWKNTLIGNLHSKDPMKTDTEWNVQFKNILLEHHAVPVIDEALVELGPKIWTKPDNCRPDSGTVITERVNIDLKKSMHRGGWWNTVAGGVTWVRYHWERQPHLLCNHCFTVEHNDEECENTELDLKIRRYINEEYISYCHNLATHYGVEIIEDLDQLMQQICEASRKQLEEQEKAEKLAEARKAKRSRSDDDIETESNIGQNIGSTDKIDNFDGMEHDLAEEGDQPARENSHGMVEAFAVVNQLQISWNTNINGSAAFNLSNKQKRIRKRLSHWNKVEFGDIDRNINNLQAQLETIQNDMSYNSHHDNIVAITKKLDDWFNIKEDFYRQKSGDSFITEMDHNTKYFHTLANRRMCRKNIDCLCDTNDVWYSDSKDIVNLLVDHFSQVSKTTVPVFTDITFDILPTVITAQDNNNLTIIPTMDEIHQTIKHMSAWSSPGPDRFQEGFYQYNWDIIGKDISTTVQSFFETGYMSKDFNKTYLSLIPKTDNAKSPVDFRPIGLCNTVCKVISKIIADRIKSYLKHLISPYQAAFVPGRDIHYNIIVAHEMIHTMKHKEGHSGTMVLKLDLSKAFDRIEWNFLLGVLKKFGFDAKFGGFIEQCMSTTTISVLLNGSPTQSFSPTIGIRQGDLLSPYLFILCMEFLSRLLLNVETNHLISGVKAARKAPGIIHLMFVDDILIFTKADMHNIEGIMGVLGYFSNVSVQMLNLDKSNVYFSHNIPLSYRNFLARELRMTQMTDTVKYMGVTLLIGRDKTKAFKPLIQSFGTRLKFWKGKTMNHSARTTMVKHVLNDLPTYQMGFFRIPKTMIDQMDSIQKNFWWGHSDNKGLCLIGWNKMHVPKALGGLGIRNLEHFNTALLTKVAWKACNNDNSLYMQIVRSKYGNNGKLLHLYKLKEDCSWLWRSIYSGIEVLQQHSKWIVQCGTKIKIWIYNWIIGLNCPPIPTVVLSSFVSFTFVCDLFYPGTRVWNEQIISAIFDVEDSNAILSMYVPDTGEDYLIWKPDRRGKFSVKSAYNALCAEDVNNAIIGDTIPTEVWKTLWNFKVPHRVQLFIWKCLKNIVPVRGTLTFYKADIDSQCGFCSSNTETISHLLVECSYARTIWNISDVIQNFNSIQDWIISWLYSNTYEGNNSFLMTDSIVIKLMCAVCVSSSSRIFPKIWFPPDTGYIKVNIDASYVYETKKGSIGLIVRDHATHALAVKGFSLEEEIEAEVGAEHFECKALIKAVEWIEEYGFNKVIIETDCENLVKSIHLEDPQVHWINHHLFSVKNKFSIHEFWFCKLVNRLSNSVAHELASKARLEASSFSFVSNFPPDIVKWIEDDNVLSGRV
ncbi:uncharacterized protein LOC113360696 [Papaver somniferum]|uniref:uncharacterized protein LOC113360696 n=1 Tax=Papaver somniferum TaxID=3469 RepID=UPI000E702335|nr:uncharacterized protein LOC113360696 [Papaver somniferum]